MNRMKLAVVGVLALAAIVVVAQNTASVETRLLFVTVTMPRSLLLLLTLAIGFVLGLLVSIIGPRKEERPS